MLDTTLLFGIRHAESSERVAMTKTLLTIFTLLFSTVMFSSPSYSEWTKVSESVSGNTFYIDFERILKHGGFVYYWYLRDGLKPDEYGDFSAKIYVQGDCNLFRVKFLSFSYYKEPMGGGTVYTSNQKIEEWKYPPLNSSNETILKRVCSR